MKGIIKKQKISVSAVGWILLVLLALVVLGLACGGSHQASMSIMVPCQFQGEYRQGEGEWAAIGKDSGLSALEGDVYLKGCFEWGLPEGMQLNFYLDHIAMSVSVNGEIVYMTSTMEGDTAADMCGSRWDSWISTGIQSEDTVEIHLKNNHRFGNKNAVSEFLDTFYVCPAERLESLVGTYSRPYWIGGFFTIVISMLLLGMALGFRILHISRDNLLFHLGLFSFFFGGYVLLDTPDISLKLNLVVFYTYGRQICIMLAGVELGICILEYLNGKRRKVAGICTAIMGVTDGILLLLVLSGKMILYDTIPVWVMIVFWLCIVFSGTCISEYRKGKTDNCLTMAFFLLMLISVILEFLNYFTYWWNSGLCVKIVFFILIMFNLVKAVISVSENYRDSMNAKKLGEELKNSRIVLSSSQIRTHFVFNVLNAISGLCKYDPVRADEMVICFSRYLRVNMDILKEDKLVPFRRIVKHLEDYVTLEQLRFDDQIRFVEKIETDNFKIPYLILQPIVENSIKHGLLPRPEGGTIELHAKTEGDQIIISVTDDGIGYDVNAIDGEDSLGLANVRFRLQYMVNGKMNIESKSGEGTKVTITIPNDSYLLER